MPTLTRPQPEYPLLPDAFTRQRQLIADDEGFRSRSYLDTEGINTIGTGFNITDPSIRPLLPPDVLSGKRAMSESENTVALNTLVLRAQRDAAKFVGSDERFRALPAPWQDSLVNMAYQLGLPRLKGFKNLRTAILANDPHAAAREVLDSKVAREQTPDRFQRNSQRFLRGVSNE